MQLDTKLFPVCQYAVLQVTNAIGTRRVHNRQTCVALLNKNHKTCQQTRQKLARRVNNQIPLIKAQRIRIRVLEYVKQNNLETYNRNIK